VPELRPDVHEALRELAVETCHSTRRQRPARRTVSITCAPRIESMLTVPRKDIVRVPGRSGWQTYAIAGAAAASVIATAATEIHGTRNRVSPVTAVAA
jgi:hypothetical protein